jgi:hypothetical protein
MSKPDDGVTLKLGVESLTTGYRELVDSGFQTAIDSTKAGGDAVEAYFAAENSTADFWGLVAAKNIGFAPGTDKEGRPVVMASSGNVELRVQALPKTSASSAGSHAAGAATGVGTLTIETRNTTTSVTRVMSGVVVVVENPSSVSIDADVFNQLVPALYEGVEQLLQALAATIAQASQVENPDVDADSLTASVITFASESAIKLSAGLVKAGLHFVAVSWAGWAAELAGISALVAIPLIIEFLGHQMYHSLIVQNLTDTDLSWSATSIHGDSTVQPAGTTIGAMSTQPDPLGSGSMVTYSSSLNLQYVNDTRWSSIGYVVGLQPSGGGAGAQLLVSIPWAGTNTIWTGSASGSGEAAWEAHASQGDGALTSVATLDDFSVTLSLNKSKGETDGTYFYCSTAVVEPA